MLDLMIFILVAVVLSAILSIASYLLAIRRPTSEKVSAYECGFDPFIDARHTFEVRFFLVAILFIIFDLEISILFPWVLVVTLSNYWIIMTFLFVLTIGLVYEWKKGALEWE